MAKRRRVKNDVKSRRSDSAPQSPPELATTRLDPICFGIGLLAGTVVYVSYYPSDSVMVEKGDALWFAALAIVISMIVFAARAWLGPSSPALPENQTNADGSGRLDERRVGRLLDIVPWALAAWMMLAAVNTSPPGNLRMATNEAWLWVSAAAIFTSARRLMARPGARKAMIVLLVVCGTGLAVHGLHQQLVSLPQNRAEYRQDPDRILDLAGVSAPKGSAERMIFENRLFDGGPTGTFALANSLAGLLLVCVIVAAGVLRFHWARLQSYQRIGWAMVAGLCSAALLAARSRSAVLALLIAIALILIAASRLHKRNRKSLLIGLAGLSLLGVGCAIAIAVVGNREWFEEAPASLAVRFQYWHSTWQLVLDHPLFGAGPGNFQSMYERYREATTTEQVAEPHNLFFETLASGGFIGLGLLILAIIVGFLFVSSRAGDAQANPIPDDGGRWVWLGAGLSLAMVWLLGLVSRHIPDLDASVFVLPTVLVAAFALAPSVSNLPSRDLDSIASVALIAILIHLMVAGGWTVPGIAIIVWIFAAILTRRDKTLASDPSCDFSSDQLTTPVHCSRVTSTASAPIRVALVIGSSLIILATLYLVSLRPVETQKRLLSRAALARASGQLGIARRTLEEASDADPWSPDAALWLAEFYGWQMILQGDSAEARRQWEAHLEKAKQRAGEDPAIYRLIGAQQLHLYQRYGKSRDLEAAAETFTKAVQWSPANQWMMAQMAVVAEAGGQAEQAQMLGKRAAELAQLGGNIERALSRQQVYVARPIGIVASQGPRRLPADELLSGLGGTD